MSFVDWYDLLQREEMNNCNVMLLSIASGYFDALFTWAKDRYKVSE